MEKNQKPSIIVGSIVKVEKIDGDYAYGSEIYVGRIGQVYRTKWGKIYVEFDDESQCVFKMEDLSPI